LANLLPPMAVWAFWSLLLALLILWASAAAGGRCLETLKGAGPFEKAVLGTALGLGILALSVMLLAWAGGLRSSLVPVVGLAGLGFWGWRGARKGWAAVVDEARAHGLVWAPSALILLAVGWAAWVPPHQYDSLVYHLALPQAYLRQGSLRPIPGILYTHLTQNAEMLFTLSLWLGSDLCAQFLTVGATALTAGLLWGLARRYASAGVSAGAVFLFLSHTGVMLLGSTTYVEPWVGLWLLASIVCFLRWWDVRSPSIPLPRGGEGARVRWLCLAGIFSGLACGTKYYAVICPFLLSLFMFPRLRKAGSTPAPSQSSGTMEAPEARVEGDRPRRHLESRWRTRGFHWKEAALFLGAVALPVLPWLIKNWVYVGNPVFPFLYKFFPAVGVDWGSQPERYFSVLTEYGHPRGLLFELLLFPYQLFRDTLRFGGGMDVLGDLGWPLAFLGFPLAVGAMRKERVWRFFGLYLAGHFALWFVTRVVLRFLVPVLPLFSLVAARGYADLWRRASGAGRYALLAGLSLFLISRLYAFGYVHAIFQSHRVLFGMESPGAYLARRLAYYPCAERAGQELGPNDRILIVGEQRSYYLEAENLPTSVYQRNLYQVLARKAADANGLGRSLREKGFSHILWVPGEAERLKGYGAAEGLEGPAWQDLLERFPVLHRTGGCVLYAIPQTERPL